MQWGKYLFITTKYMGEETILEPRVPLSLNNYEDSNTKRICVGVDLSSCLKAIMLEPKKYYVYETEESFGHIPKEDEVPDVLLTNERWLLCSTPITLKGFVNMKKHKDLCYHPRGWNIDHCHTNLDNAVYLRQIESFKEIDSKAGEIKVEHILKVNT